MDCAVAEAASTVFRVDLPQEVNQTSFCPKGCPWSLHLWERWISFLLRKWRFCRKNKTSSQWIGSPGSLWVPPVASSEFHLCWMPFPFLACNLKMDVAALWHNSKASVASSNLLLWKSRGKVKSKLFIPGNWSTGSFVTKSKVDQRNLGLRIHGKLSKQKKGPLQLNKYCI